MKAHLITGEVQHIKLARSPQLIVYVTVDLDVS